MNCQPIREIVTIIWSTTTAIIPTLPGGRWGSWKGLMEMPCFIHKVSSFGIYCSVFCGAKVNACLRRQGRTMITMAMTTIMMTNAINDDSRDGDTDKKDRDGVSLLSRATNTF